MHLWAALVCHRNTDFTLLCLIDTKWADQTEVNKKKALLFLACALYYNFDLSVMIRYTGGNYVSAEHDVSSILASIQNYPTVPKVLVEQVCHFFTFGAPSYFNATNSKENFMTYLRYGNHHSIASNLSKVMKTMNKETKKCFSIRFPACIATFCQNCHVTPSGLIIKPGKNDCLIFDGSFLPNWSSISINQMQSPKFNPKIVYSTALLCHLERIYNLCISYPDEDIYLFDDNVLDAF